MLHRNDLMRTNQAVVLRHFSQSIDKAKICRDLFPRSCEKPIDFLNKATSFMISLGRYSRIEEHGSSADEMEPLQVFRPRHSQVLTIFRREGGGNGDQANLRSVCLILCRFVGLVTFAIHSRSLCIFSFRDFGGSAQLFTIWYRTAVLIQKKYGRTVSQHIVFFGISLFASFLDFHGSVPGQENFVRPERQVVPSCARITVCNLLQCSRKAD